MELTVGVATYGDKSWADAAKMAVDSAKEVVGAGRVLQVHLPEGGLHDARNLILDFVETEWVCFLDADDELHPGYLHAMSRGTADLRAPSVEYVGAFIPTPPYMPRVAGHDHTCEAACLRDGNWLVIGTCARTNLLREVGGFREFPMYEDWDLWARCWQAGATIEAVPDAVYRATVRRDSRNRAPDREAKLEAHRMVARANGLPVPA